MKAALTTSTLFRLALLRHRASGIRVWQIAAACGVRAPELSAISTGSIRVRENDRRVVAVAKHLGLDPGLCFEPLPEETPQLLARGVNSAEVVTP